MEEAAINTKGIAVLKPELDRINRLHSKNELAGEISHLHEITFALDESTDSGAKTVAFGFASQQDFDDASKVVAFADQGGLGLPDRDYYLKDDAESAETRKQYQAHVQKMFQLTGEAPGQARADSKTVLDMETALAKSSMDIVKRRDPANLNHKLTAQQLRALTPSFSWDDYLKLIGAPPTAHYLLLTPDFYKGTGRPICAGIWCTIRLRYWGSLWSRKTSTSTAKNYLGKSKYVPAGAVAFPTWIATWVRLWGKRMWSGLLGPRANSAC
jgi:putative endopeptidase